MSAKILPALEVIAGIAIDYFTGGTGGNYLIAAGLASEASILLAPKPPVPTRAPVQGTLRQTDAYANLVYGTQKMGGVLVYENTTGSQNETLDIVVAHAITDPTQGIDGFGSFYLNNHEIRVRPYETWQANHLYAVGDAIEDSNHNAQECVTGGLSGGAPPNWSTVKGDLTYGGGVAVWKLVGGKASDITWDADVEQGLDGYVRPLNPSAYSYVHGHVTGGLFAGKVEVWAYTGAQDSYGKISPTLASTYGSDPVLPWKDTAIGKGVVWTHWRCTPGTDAADFEKAFGGSLPYSLEVVIRGEKVLDPRTSTTAYSENPALIARDFLTRAAANGGCGVDASIIDDTNSTIPSANVCDQAVEMADTTYGPRFRGAGSVSMGNKRGDELHKILLAMGGYLVNRGISVNNLAPVCIYSGSYTSPSGTIDETFMRGSATFNGVHQNSRYNSVRATFTDKYNNWQSMSAPPVPALASTDFANWVAEDGGSEIDKHVQLDFVPDSDHAQLVAGIIARQSRYLDSVVLQCNYKAIAFNVFDRVWLDNAELGISGDVYRITRMTKQQNFGVDVYLTPDVDTVWGSTIPQVGPIVPDGGETFTSTPNVSGLTAVGYSGGNKLTWSAPDAHRVKHTYIFYSSDGGATYTQIDTVPGAAAQYLHPLANGLTGYYQIQFANDVVVGTLSSPVNSTSGLAESNADNTGQNVSYDDLVLNSAMEEDGYWDLSHAAYVTTTISGDTGRALQLTEATTSTPYTADFSPYNTATQNASLTFGGPVSSSGNYTCNFTIDVATPSTTVNWYITVNGTTVDSGSLTSGPIATRSQTYAEVISAPSIAVGQVVEIHTDTAGSLTATTMTWAVTNSTYAPARQLDSVGNRRYLRVNPGDRLYLVGDARRTGTASASCILQLVFTDQNKANPQYSSMTMSPTGSGVTRRGVFLVPSGAYYATVQPQIQNDGTGGTTCEYKNIHLYKNTYEHSSADTLGSSSYTYTSTTSSITVAWSGFKVYWADQYTEDLPDGSSAYTGLASGTPYVFYGYWDMLSSSMNFAGGANTSSSIAEAQIQNAYTHIPFGVLNAPTTSSGTGGGGGGGFGIGCLHEASVVTTRDGDIEAAELVPGSEVYTPDGWTPVLTVEQKLHNTWLEVTLDTGVRHIWTDTQPVVMWDDTMVRAVDLKIGDHVVIEAGLGEVIQLSRRRQHARKVIIAIASPHLFFQCRGGALVHNGTVKP